MDFASFHTQLHQIGSSAEKQVQTIQENRFVPDELLDQLKDTGAFRLWVAKAYGGYQSHVLDLMQAVQILSYYNGSLGWILGVTGTAALSSGYLPPAVAAHIYGHPRALTGGWAAPAGQAKRVDGGILVNGKWSWGSGIRYCSHIVGGVMLEQGEGKGPISAIAFFNPKDVQFIDNWEVLGLNGTNSIDYQVESLFVPDGQWMYFPVRKAQIDTTLYRFSFLGALSTGVASVGLGLAKRAMDEIIKLSQQKIPNGARRLLSERPVIHEKIALMKARYGSSKLLLEDSVRKNWEEAEKGNISLQTKSELRLASTYAAQQACDIVSQAYKIGGGSSIWNGVKLQELLRDVHVVSQHGMVGPSNFEIAGRVAFDLKVNPWLL